MAVKIANLTGNKVKKVHSSATLEDAVSAGENDRLAEY